MSEKDVCLIIISQINREMTTKPVRFSTEYMNSCAQWVKEKKSWTNIPISEVEFVMKNTPPTKFSKEQTAFMLALNRRSNRICESCGYKENIETLIPCEKCYLLHYCNNNTCQRQHWISEHKMRCCKEDAPREKGYSATVLINTVTGEKK